ncbi:uncharacterized protein LOC124453391 [Xenia sp. Carnegie-2017]|uniref:uncharacterized protein LOC124453391 n=1 Tax=Xenia sp. Carnegie-2017 TaxID=2897299 RepID=UPI001F043A0F|nr:uncharacterized protein LOC124453391 [Xenia sp. Carnegie-2017]
MIALSNLKKNKNIVVCKPDKGSGVEILDREDYNSKMLNILKDNNKFWRLENCQSAIKLSANGAERPRMHSNLTMCSFDVTSLFTNVLLEETIEICAQNLFHSDMTLPDMSENAFGELMMAPTKGVEFSFDDTMYKQIDGMAMGSPLGPVLANIFVGYHECKMLASSDCPDVLWYKRYVDDTFSLFHNDRNRALFLNKLCSLTLH